MGRGRGRCGWTTWTGSSSSTSKVVRKTSCRAMMRSSAPARVAASSGPRSRHAAGTLYSGLPGSIRSTNQSRRWAYETGRT